MTHRTTHIGKLFDRRGRDFDKGLAHPYNWSMNNTEQKKLTKDQLKVIALKQRIGEITSDYEENIADIRAHITQMQEHFEEVIRNQEKDIESLQAQLRNYQNVVQEEEPDNPADSDED